MQMDHPITDPTFGEDDQFCDPCFVSLLGEIPDGLNVSGFAISSSQTSASSPALSIKPPPDSETLGSSNQHAESVSANSN